MTSSTQLSPRLSTPISSWLILPLLLLGCARDKPSEGAGGATDGEVETPEDTAVSDAGGADTAGTGQTTGGDSDGDSGAGSGDDTGLIDSGDSGATGDAGGDTDSASPGTIPDLPVAGCGAPAYSWQPLEAMGAVLDYEDAGLSYPASGIDLVMEAYGLGEYTPVPYGVKVWRVRYVTQDRGEQVEATALVSVPDLPEPASVPALVFLHPTTGFTGECAPTATGLTGGAFNILFSSQGAAVVTPDYLGMNGWGEPSELLHPYMVAEPTAVASLDGLRALHAFAADQELAAQPDPAQTLLMGASEGGFAALWAQRYAPRYAPEFTILGVAAAVAPSNPPAVAADAVASLSDTTWAVAAALATANPWYGEPAPLSDALTDEEPHSFASTLAERLTAECYTYGDEDITSVAALFQEDVAAALLDGGEAAPFTCYLEESSLRSERIALEPTGAAAAPAPVLLTGASRDLIVGVEPIRDDVPALCDMGYEVEYMECSGIGHIAGSLDPIPLQWEWLLARLDGAPLGETCVVTEPIECPDLYNVL